MKQIFRILLLLFIFVTLVPESVSAKSVDSKNNTKEKFKFVDVFREEYEIELDKEAAYNSFNKYRYRYYKEDKAGRVLVSDSIKPGSSLGDDKKSETVGYEGIITYNDDAYTSRFGIDVSKYQGNIDWNKVKEAGVEFAIIRIGFRGYGKAGNLVEDACFKRNLEGAKSAGIDTGVYFYAQAINEEEAIEEAEFVLKLLDGEELKMPVVYDPEHVLNDTARTDNVTGEQFTKNAIAFTNKIKEAGYDPMIYANMMWEAFDFDMSELKDIPFWYADYEKKPQTPYDYTMWQYTQSGKISGIKGTVDLNVQLIKK